MPEIFSLRFKVFAQERLLHFRPRVLYAIRFRGREEELELCRVVGSIHRHLILLSRFLYICTCQTACAEGANGVVDRAVLIAQIVVQAVLESAFQLLPHVL
jgi:hypothetical protein